MSPCSLGTGERFSCHGAALGQHQSTFWFRELAPQFVEAVLLQLMLAATILGLPLCPQSPPLGLDDSVFAPCANASQLGISKPATDLQQTFWWNVAGHTDYIVCKPGRVTSLLRVSRANRADVCCRSVLGLFRVHFGSMSGPFRVHFGSIQTKISI